MYLLATALIPLTDISVDRGFITGYNMRILLAGQVEQFRKAGLIVPNETDDQGEPVAEAGTAVVERLHINLVDERGAGLHDTCDADSSDWEGVFDAFLSEDGDHGCFQDIPETEDCYSKDVLLIQDISLKPEYRGRGIEMAVAQRVIESVGSGCDLVVYLFGQHPDELEALKPMGFNPGPVEGYAFVNLNYEHPTVGEVEFCKFGIVPALDEVIETVDTQ